MLHVWRRPGRASVTLSPLWNPFCHLHVKRQLGCRLSWRHVRGRGSWSCGVGPLRFRVVCHPNISNFSTSTCRGSIDLRYHMSRLRSALDSVSKVVSGTQVEIRSRIGRLKPSSDREAEAKEAGQETPSEKEQERFYTSDRPQGLPETPPSAPPSTTTGTFEQNEFRLTDTCQSTNNITATSQAATSRDKNTAPVTAQQTTPLFHPGSLSAQLGETYSYVSHHINSYFVSLNKTEKIKDIASSTRGDSRNGHKSSSLVPVKEVEPSVASSAVSVNKGLGNYFNYSSTSVQAFVGNYITPLVPRFRSDGKVQADKPSHPENDTKLKKTSSKEQRDADERARRLLLQREKIIARVSVDNRTRALVQALHRASDVRLYISRVEELSLHLLEFPETRSVAIKEKVIPRLLRLRLESDASLKAAVREALALSGYIEPVKNRGIRILSIDGGGTRGLLALQALHRFEELSGRPIYQLFDYICGVSTGAILGFMLGVFQIPLKECEDLYRKLSSDVFRQNVIVGTVKMGWSHAFYDSEIWEKVLKEKMGSDILIETSRNPDCPKVAAVSTVVNRGPPIKAYVFRNYTLPPGVRSHYRGGCHHKMWEAIRASSAAPGYFQEFALGNDLHQDGGLLINNPTALAIHECQCLWPGVPLECVVSLGTGRFETSGRNSVAYTSLKTKLSNVISSATNTEEVHTMLDALLPPHTYFRFNPYMSEEVPLDESRDEKLQQMQTEGLRYLERNQEKVRRVVHKLTRDKSSVQTLTEWLRLKAYMYKGLYKV
ncbi:calcium-independent phospholipase A2-gamma-like isoform X1 [Triplophysa dalaica]|uniref:calcium-independent phospholipase A2-gamma-like isoform X1 n=1 Tax=Triplophysa dalaica TaxID=1582913 RepID=UPI0024DF9596|nr:calcium-independent phospholipase A2-gamma-like isoform X1 [Triplophysa dalaica]